jgi:hypothetical protein
MLAKGLLIIIGILGIQVLTRADELQVNNPSPLKQSYQQLTDCQLNICKAKFKVESMNVDGDKKKFSACQSGCNILVIDGADKCESKCSEMFHDDDDEEIACLMGCQSTKQMVGNEESLINNVPPVRKITDEEKQSLPFINGKRPLQEIFIIDENGKKIPYNEEYIKQQEQKKQQEQQGKTEDDSFSGLFSLLDSIMNRGAPSNVDTDTLMPTPNEQDQESGDEDWVPMHRMRHFCNKVLEHLNNAMIPNSDMDGEFYYFAQLLENGTIIESFKRPEPRQKIGLLGGKDDIDNQGLPYQMPSFQDRGFMPYHERRVLRQCIMPLKFQWSTLCHDVNNFFNCLSIRSGLPKWFFLSMILLASFSMIWLSLFILSMLRRMRRRERIIQLEEDYLPLYKDLEFDVKRQPIFYEAEPLPEKKKLEDI